MVNLPAYGIAYHNSLTLGQTQTRFPVEKKDPSLSITEERGHVSDRDFTGFPGRHPEPMACLGPQQDTFLDLESLLADQVQLALRFDRRLRSCCRLARLGLHRRHNRPKEGIPEHK